MPWRAGDPGAWGGRVGTGISRSGESRSSPRRSIESIPIGIEELEIRRRVLSRSAIMIVIRTTEDLGVTVRRIRRAQGLRQPDLALACGTSVRFIVELEHGKATAQVGKVLLVLRMLRIQVALDGGEG
jgi:ribosome-binding protein aMBF1 (putative translation factor)